MPLSRMHMGLPLYTNADCDTPYCFFPNPAGLASKTKRQPNVNNSEKVGILASKDSPPPTAAGLKVIFFLRNDQLNVDLVFRLLKQVLPTWMFPHETNCSCLCNGAVLVGKFVIRV